MRVRPLSRVEIGIIAAFVAFFLLAQVSPLLAGSAVLLAWAGGPLSVALYLGGLVLGRVSTDGLPYLLVGGLFSLLWVVAAVAVTIRGIGNGLRAMLYVVSIILDVLALGAGRAAIKQSVGD